MSQSQSAPMRGRYCVEDAWVTARLQTSAQRTQSAPEATPVEAPEGGSGLVAGRPSSLLGSAGSAVCLVIGLITGVHGGSSEGACWLVRPVRPHCSRTYCREQGVFERKPARVPDSCRGPAGPLVALRTAIRAPRDLEQSPSPSCRGGGNFATRSAVAIRPGRGLSTGCAHAFHGLPRPPSCRSWGCPRHTFVQDQAGPAHGAPPSPLGPRRVPDGLRRGPAGPAGAPAVARIGRSGKVLERRRRKPVCAPSPFPDARSRC